MANQAIIGGKTTQERLLEEWQRLLDSQEHVSVTEYARRARISYHTLTHNYKDWAEKVRKFSRRRKSQAEEKIPCCSEPRADHRAGAGGGGDHQTAEPYRRAYKGAKHHF